MGGDHPVLEERLAGPGHVVDDHGAARCDQVVDGPVEPEHAVAVVVEVELGAGGDVVDDLEHRGPLVAALLVGEDPDLPEVTARPGRRKASDAVRDHADPDAAAGQAPGPERVGADHGVARGRDLPGRDHGPIHLADLPDALEVGEGGELGDGHPCRDEPVPLVAVDDPREAGLEERGRRPGRELHVDVGPRIGAGQPERLDGVALAHAFGERRREDRVAGAGVREHRRLDQFGRTGCGGTGRSGRREGGADQEDEEQRGAHGAVPPECQASHEAQTSGVPTSERRSVPISSSQGGYQYCGCGPIRPTRAGRERFNTFPV